MRITIKVTKDVLRKTAMCSGGVKHIRENCAISYAVREIFPAAQTFVYAIVLSDHDVNIYEDYLLPQRAIDVLGDRCIPLPEIASAFIRAFDFLADDPEARMNMAEISFEIDVPPAVIERIGISEVYRVLSESKTLELTKTFESI
jgi:hypothetical protein